MSSTAKDRIRCELLNRRDRIPLDLRRQSSRKICLSLEKLIEERRFSRSLFYLNMRSEVETDWLVARQLATTCLVAIPRVEGKEIYPYQLTNLQTEINQHKWGMREPNPTICSPIDPESLDLVLVPGCGFDSRRYRIGYGGGFYDRFLAAVDGAITVGLTYDDFIIDRIPAQDHDIPLHLVITPSGVFTPAAKGS